jgi:hypothetical protein
VYQNIVTISHLWPGIHPLNVWELPYDMWLLYVAAAKDWEEKAQEG